LPSVKTLQPNRLYEVTLANQPVSSSGVGPGGMSGIGPLHSRHFAGNWHQLFRGVRVMPAEPVQPITELLRAAQAGDAAAAERLLAVVYEQLQQVARANADDQ
jgi:hypothetical protein